MFMKREDELKINFGAAIRDGSLRLAMISASHRVERAKDIWVKGEVSFICPWKLTFFNLFEEGWR